VTEILTIIVNYRTPALAEKCIAALAAERAGGVSLTAILADGCSGDDSVSRLKKYLRKSCHDSWVELLPLDFNGGFGWANNQGILHYVSKAGRVPDYIYLLNPDAEVAPGAVTALLQRLRNTPEAAAAGSQLYEPGGTKAASAFRFPALRREFAKGAHVHALERLLGLEPLVVDLTAAAPVDWVTGASVLFRSAALAQTGLFDDGFFLYYEEVELMQRLQRVGWQIWSEPESRVAHIGGAATGVHDVETPKPMPLYWFQSRLYYFARTGGMAEAAAANIAWFAGYLLLGLPRLILSSKTRRNAQPGEAQGIWNAGFLLPRRMRRASVPGFDTKPGALPAWNQDT
jgi:N-acetylglucosaminyl-diphospho-decaprenol L-rhamnosyltransferase